MSVGHAEHLVADLTRKSIDTNRRNDNNQIFAVRNNKYANFWATDCRI